MTRSRQWYGWKPDKPDYRDRLFSPRVTALPTSIDLRGACPPVMDQGPLGSCTAHGITGAARYDLIKSGKPDYPMARLQLYYDERAIEGDTKTDAGAEIRDGIKTLAKLGVAHELLWPYDVKKFASKPSAKVYADAKADRALIYEKVSVTTLAVKQALASGFVVVIGLTLFESFEGNAVAKTGLVPMPSAKEQMVGGHCVYVVGYGQHPGTFTIRNSWAADWGDKGDCYFPEAYIGSAKFGSDYWVIRSVG